MLYAPSLPWEAHMHVRLLLAAALLMAGCGSSQPQGDGSGYAGRWTGTKDYYAADGTWLASSSWFFELTGAAPRLQFVNGPSASVAEDGSLVVARYEYEPLHGPGLGCGPIAKVITGGTGHHVGADGLELTLLGTSSCGGASSDWSVKYTMTRAEESPYVPGL